MQETERRSGGRLKTQRDPLYPVLHRLQEQGLISDRRVLVGKRMKAAYTPGACRRSPAGGNDPNMNP